jgi:glycosyltransferase involved in cell wall biosynthesis
MRGIDLSVSAHAKDVWTIPEWEKRGKLASARWAVTCTETGRRHLADLAPMPDTVMLSYHGLDLDRFAPAPARADTADGGDSACPVTLLSVGRAVAKKGYDDLLAALALLPAGLSWRLVHVGGGALAGQLKREAARLGLERRIEWRGGQPQPEVLRAYREADLFVLAAKVAKDGDRDGLPNVLLEAQSQGLACVATALPGIAELIEDGRSGVLVAPADPQALAKALERMIRSPALRRRLGEAGEARVRRDFDMNCGIESLARLFHLLPELLSRPESVTRGAGAERSEAGYGMDPHPPAPAAWAPPSPAMRERV